MEEVRIRLQPLDRLIKVRKGTPLQDVLHEVGVEFPCGGKGSCGRCRVHLLEGELERDAAQTRLLDKLGLDYSWRLACRCRVETDLVLEVAQHKAPILAGEEAFGFVPAKGYGVAFDLGTTSLVAQLLDLSSGKVLAVEKDLNPQRRAGSDLVSRLEYARVHGPDELTNEIRAKCGEMMFRLLEQGKIRPGKIVFVGNTVMQHLFCGLDVSPLSFYPFESDQLGMKRMGAAELDWQFDFDRLCFYPSIGSFVGSDILAGIHATGMAREKVYQLLIDLGTNGEIAIGNCEGILCASTAAGPAFEGANISHGMLASTGAISSVTWVNEKFNCHVIGNTEAQGICGSGLIDAVALGVDQALIGEFGEFISGDESIELTEGIYLTQKDVQEFLLAKAAIAGGILILLRKLGITAADISSVHIAGAFGNYINLEHMLRTGMLDFDAEKIHRMGNSALMGARMFLYSGEELSTELLSLCRHVNLEGEADFQDIFVNELKFRS